MNQLVVSICIDESNDLNELHLFGFRAKLMAYISEGYINGLCRKLTA